MASLGAPPRRWRDVGQFGPVMVRGPHHPQRPPRLLPRAGAVRGAVANFVCRCGRAENHVSGARGHGRSAATAGWRAVARRPGAGLWLVASGNTVRPKDCGPTTAAVSRLPRAGSRRTRLSARGCLSLAVCLPSR